MQLITALSETNNECDGQNIPMYNNSACGQIQPIFSTSYTTHNQLHNVGGNVGGCTGSPPHGHAAKVVYRPTHTLSRRRHPTGNYSNHNHPGGVAASNELINSPELSRVIVNADETTDHKRPLSAPPVVLNVPKTSISSRGSITSPRNADRDGFNVQASPKLQNQNSTTDMILQNISEIHFSNHIELDRSRPEGVIGCIDGNLPEELYNKPYIDNYDENMNLSNTVNNNLFIPGEQSDSLRQIDERNRLGRSCHTHNNKYEAASQNVFPTCDMGSEINNSLETACDLNNQSTSGSVYWISCDEVPYKTPPIWTSLALRENHLYSASVIVPLPKHSVTRAVNVHCNHLFAPIHCPGKTRSLDNTEVVTCPCRESSIRDTPDLEDVEVSVYFERQRFELEQSQLGSNRFQSEQGSWSSNTFETEQSTINSDIFQREQSPFSSNRFQSEKGPLSRNIFHTEQSPMRSNSFDLLHLGSNGSQIDNFHLMGVPNLDLTYSVDDACEPVTACDGDCLVGARMEFSPTLVNLQCFLRLLPSLHKCRDQLSDELTPLYQDNNGEDWLSDEYELDFDETEVEISETPRPTNPVAQVLCNGGNEHFLPVSQTILDSVFHG